MFSILLKYTLIYGTVLALVALGGMFSERSGIINIGLEGIMVIGALCGALVLSILTTKVNNFPVSLAAFLAIIASIVGGWLYSLLLGFACIKFNADQTLTGTALNIMSTALAVVIARVYTKTPSSEIIYDKSGVIFTIGKSGFQFTIFTIIMIVLVALAFIFLYKTKWGLRLMACGEHPQAADSVGINVYKQRYLGVSLSGMIGGLGGLAYILPSVSKWDFQYGVAGFGFLALAVMIFGQWKPTKILLAALLFGFFRSLASAYILFADSNLGFIRSLVNIPGYVYNMLPYIVCMIVLAFTSKKSRAPKAEGIPYDKGAR